MRAEIIRDGQGYTATFVRRFSQKKEEVWAMLTENAKLQQWFPELTIENLQKGGTLRFDFENGTYETMAILDYEEGEKFVYEWGKDTVRFEVSADNSGTQLVLTEALSTITPHTAKDLAGWHVCLDVVEALLEGKEIARQEEWEKEYPEYQRLLDSMTVSFE